MNRDCSSLFVPRVSRRGCQLASLPQIFPVFPPLQFLFLFLRPVFREDDVAFSFFAVEFFTLDFLGLVRECFLWNTLGVCKWDKGMNSG